jgi:uncharacterized protein (TIGR03086 family)
MEGPAAIWQQAADNFDRHLHTIGDDQWDAPTGCGDWTVRDLVDHTVHWQAVVGGVVGADTSPGDEWPVVRAAIIEALKDPSNLEGNAPQEVMGGMPKHQILGIGTGDVLLHSWDLARALGADDTLPPAAVQAVYMGMQRLPEAMLRSPKMFGPAIDVGDDASEQDRLLGFTGRQP